MQVARWGNSLAIRIPAAVVRALHLKEGDEVNVVSDGVDTVKVERTPSREDALAQLRKFRGRLPKDWKFDRDEANER